jgi:hypothetical protein
MLKPPHVSRVCRELGLGSNIIRIDEAIEAIIAKT